MTQDAAQNSYEARVFRAQDDIAEAMRRAAEGNPYAAEHSDKRICQRLQDKLDLTEAQAEAALEAIRAAEADHKAPSFGLPGLERVFQEPDFVDVAFLERGVVAAKAVARVNLGGQGYGTGFLASPRLFMTNQHVLENVRMAAGAAVEFDYELDVWGRPKTPTRFRLDPQRFYTSDPATREGLDYALIALGERLSGPGRIEDYGWLGISDDENRHIIGEYVNVIQHPAARMKEVVLRENRIVARGPEALHYVADTEPGSSGSPVFNAEWRVIALHHTGGPARNVTDLDGRIIPLSVNEGLRISAIVRQLAARRAGFALEGQTLIDEALVLGRDPFPGRDPIGIIG